jgi:hypothetical protein
VIQEGNLGNGWLAQQPSRQEASVGMMMDGVSVNEVVVAPPGKEQSEQLSVEG